MIKNLGRRKLSRTGGHRRSLLRNLAQSLFLHEKVQTTLPKAKELAVYSERLLTIARPGDLSAKKALAGEIKSAELRKKILEVLVPRYQGRNGGYTQIFKLGQRKGDAAQEAIVRLIS